MKKINLTTYVSAGILLAAMTTSFAVAIPALADSTAPTSTTRPAGQWQGKMVGSTARPAMKPAVFGTVSAVSGDTITVSGRTGFGTTTPVSTFTVDATSATVTKNNTASTVASVAVGDTVLVQGTISGSSVSATMIRDGVMPNRMMGGKGGMGRSGGTASSTPAFVGDGQPVVAGTVSTISGTTLTITNKSNVTYTVDATNAKIIAGKSTTAATIATIAVGDSVIVQGTVNGTSITATSVMDQKPVSSTTTGMPAHGLFGQIGGFFAHLFGF